MNFEDLKINKQLLKAIADIDFVYTTPIQEQAFSPIKAGNNIVGIAQTGTGKTFAYLLPLLQNLKYSEQREPRILIIAPTHELVIQILQETEKLTKHTNLRSLAIFGGANIKLQKQAIYDGTDIIIATPGRLLDLAYTGVLSLKFIKQIVFDEVDEMFSLGFRTQITNLLDMLPKKKQMIMLSATMSKIATDFIKENVVNPKIIEIAAHGTPLEKIKQSGYHIPNFHSKLNLLQMLLEENKDMNKVMVFVKSKKQADRLFSEMAPEFAENTSVIHSNKAHNTRMTAMKKFIDGETKVLIATDVVARGMDIKDVSHIINFDIPDFPGDYIHRIGRTGRADKDGTAISFINNMELEYQIRIEELMKKSIEILELPEDLYISEIFADDELEPSKIDRNYHSIVSIDNSGGAFHQKLEKNMKENSGSASRNHKVYTKSGSRKKYGGRRR